MQVWESQRQRRRSGTSSIYQNRSCHLPGRATRDQHLFTDAVSWLRCWIHRSSWWAAEPGFYKLTFIFPPLGDSNSQVLKASLVSDPRTVCSYLPPPLYFLFLNVGGLQDSSSITLPYKLRANFSPNQMHFGSEEENKMRATKDGEVGLGWGGGQRHPCMHVKTMIS